MFEGDTFPRDEMKNWSNSYNEDNRKEALVRFNVDHHILHKRSRREGKSFP